jgi:glycosyltransferase involved in cell wall biosynthesis
MLVIAWPCIHYAGAERWWFYVLDEFRKFSNIYGIVAIPTALNLGCYSCPRLIKSSNIDVIYMYPVRNKLLEVFLWTRLLIKIIRKVGIDFIVAGYQTPIIALIITLAGIVTRRKNYIVFHMPTGWLPYYRNESLRLSIINKLLIKIHEFINKLGLGYFVLVSPSVRYDLERVNLKVNKYCSLKGAGITKSCDMKYRAYDDRDIGIIYLASISKAKGIFDIPLILRSIKEVFPNVKAVIVGRMPSDLKIELQKMLKIYGIENNVDVLGYAIPAIAINYRTDAVTKVHIGDTIAMAKKTMEILSNKDHWARLSEEALAFSKSYNWTEIVKSLLMCIIRGLRE